MSPEESVREPGRLSARLVIAALAVIAGLVVGMNGGDDEVALPADAVRRGDIAVYGAYVREPASDTAAAYFTIRNVGEADDTITGVSSPVATSAMLHDIGKAPLGAGSPMDTGSMVPSEQVVVKAGETIVLQPSGGHLMLTGVTGTLAPGSTVNLQLVLEKAGIITVKAPVLALTAPAPSPAG